MALSTTQYGYIIDPMVPFTDGKGNTIKDGFVRVFVAGSSTPVITYRNFDGAANQDLIELDNSGRTKTSVIGSKGLTYKVCVYDKHHSQESPILTVDKVSVIGANITAGAGATVITGLDGLTTKPDGFVDASVVGTDGYVALDHTLVTDDLDTGAKVNAVENDRYIPLLNKDVNDPDSKISLKYLKQWVIRDSIIIAGTIYPTLQDAISDADNLSVGDVFETNGFHTSGDGGAARYRVSDTGTANGMDIISLGGGKFGVLQNDKYVDVQQLGAFGDNDHDDSDVLQYAVNISAGTERPVLLTKSYKITRIVYITSSTTILGQSSRTTSIRLYNNSRLELRRDTGNQWVYEVRMRGFCIYANDTSDFCITSNLTASQCFFEDIYMDHAAVACVKIRGSILYFKDCYFFYSPVGVQLRGNAINFEGCNFWESDTAFKCYDDTGVTFLNLSHCWIEHAHRVFDTNGNHIACFAIGTAFQGSTTSGYKVLDPINGDDTNVNLSFIQCRFSYPNETGYLFKIITKTIGSGGNSLLKFSNCYVSIPAADYLIDNSDAAIGTLGVSYESSSPIDNVFSNEGTRGAYMGPLMDFRHFTMFNSGLVVGDLKPSLDEVIALRTGYMRYDTYNGQLQCVDNNGKQRGIPWKTSTYLPRLFKNNNDLAKDVDDVREKLNDLIYILKYQGKMLQPGNQDGSLSTVVKIGENNYPVIKIGNYYWLAEDLHEPLGEENVDYVINNNGDYLYKWNALCSSSGVESPGLLAIKPLSWKMPYDVNWTNLMGSLVGDTKAEKAATLYGVDVFTGFVGNNSTGFSSNANGYYNGSFIDEGVSAKYHSSNANGDLTSVGVFSLLGNDYSYSNTGLSTSFRSCRLCMKI